MIFWCFCSYYEVCHGTMLTKKQQIRQKRSRWQNSSWADGMDGCATDPMDLATGYFQISASPQDFKPSAVYEPFCAPYNSFSKPVFSTVIMFVEFDIQHNDWKLREKYWMFLISGSLHMTRDRSHIERGASRWRKNYSLLKMILSMFWMLQPFLAPPNRETNCIVEPDNVSYFFPTFNVNFSQNSTKPIMLTTREECPDRKKWFWSNTIFQFVKRSDKAKAMSTQFDVFRNYRRIVKK